MKETFPVLHFRKRRVLSFVGRRACGLNMQIKISFARCLRWVLSLLIRSESSFGGGGSGRRWATQGRRGLRRVWASQPGASGAAVAESFQWIPFKRGEGWRAEGPSPRAGGGGRSAAPKGWRGGRTWRRWRPQRVGRPQACRSARARGEGRQKADSAGTGRRGPWSWRRARAARGDPGGGGAFRSGAPVAESSGPLPIP